jgi:poly(A) polymerase
VLPAHDLDNHLFARELYRASEEGLVDRLKLSLSDARSKAVQDDSEMMRAAGYSRLLALAENWQRPVFPVSGADLIAVGLKSGPELGARLKELEDKWVASDFTLSRTELLKS